MSGFVVPPGYVALSRPRVEGATLASLEAPLREALADGTFYEYAEHHAEARPFTGRGLVYAVPLASGDSVVVRRSRHGGLLGPLRDDKFLGATRAPHELELSLKLRHLRVSTPEIVAYATYPAGPMFRRADVVTREVPKSRDLAAALGMLSRTDSKRALIAATGKLLASLSIAGARHPDLNLKNILIADNDFGGVEAYALDVDRVWFDKPAAQVVLDANLRRLSRSAFKWRRNQGLPIEEADLLAIESSARELIELSR
ncbi:MAG: lipopolysaccharide kinase InaA family protein [Gemmatimonadaceae bacterium]